MHRADIAWPSSDPRVMDLSGKSKETERNPRPAQTRRFQSGLGYLKMYWLTFDAPRVGVRDKRSYHASNRVAPKSRNLAGHTCTGHQGD